MQEIMDGQVGLFGPDTWSGKTSPELSAADPQKEQTSRLSLKRSSKLQSREPMCMCVYPTEDGQSQGAITLKMVPGALLGAFTTASFGESPREENASRLSQILEVSPHPKYCLSAKACAGILNRAARRGKELPKELRDALEQQAIPSKCGGGVERDSYGKRAGKGALVQEDMSDSHGTPHGVAYGIDHAITTGGNSTAHGPCIYKDVEGTLKASAPHSVFQINTLKGNNPTVGIHKTDIGGALDLNGGSPACNQGGIAIVNCVDMGGGKSSCSIVKDKAPTLACIHGGESVVAVDIYNLKIDGDKATSLTTASGGSHGSGPKVMVNDVGAE